MTDMLNTAVSGLLTFQRALSTTSHNIANVNTPGYSRQSVEIGTNLPTNIGDSFFGNGVHVNAVTRSYDQFLTNEVRDTSSVYARLEKFAALAGHIDDVLADPQGGVTPMLHEFFSSVQDVADDPSATTARFAMISTGQTLSNRFQTIDGRLEDLAQNTSTDIRNTVDEINRLAVAIRDVNIALNDYSSSGNSTQQSSDLLDTRDAFIDQLSQLTDIQVINETGNNLTILIGNGQTILNDTVSFTLSAQPNPADPEQDVIVYNGLITVFDLSNQLNGGALGGLLDFRQNVLQPARQSLGRMAIGIAETFNAQMNDGMDLNGNLGQDFFSYNNPQVIGFASNAGVATVSSVISDVTSLTTDNYNLAFDGANWNLTSDSGTLTSVANGAPATLVFEGLTLTINGAGAVVGDQFTIKPTLDGAGSLQVVMNDPGAIAAALPIKTGTSLSNLGNVEITPGIVTDVTNVNLLNPATFTFDNPATSFTADVDVVVAGVPYLAGAAIPYTNNMTIDSNGWQVSLAGAPQANDVMTIESNIGGSGDNRNALNLANLQNVKIFNGGLATYQQDYGALVGFVGSQTLAANVERDAQATLLTQAVNRLSSRSAVNLDEEAADLIRFQQAYEATARIISTVQTMFETILSSVR